MAPPYGFFGPSLAFLRNRIPEVPEGGGTPSSVDSTQPGEMRHDVRPPFGAACSQNLRLALFPSAMYVVPVKNGRTIGW